MLNPVAGGKERVRDLALVVAVGALGMFFVAWPQAGTGRVPADLADGRFNLLMLEHFHRWITGREPQGFWNAAFFYPFPWVTAFSDNYLGTGLIFSLFRWAGLDREDAFRWWYLAGFAANYAACAYVLAKFRLRALAVAAGAFIFTFNMAATWNSGHVQLLYRCGIPLAVYFFYRALREGRLMDWTWCFAWLVWQFYVGIYIGTFLAMLLAAFGAAKAALALADAPRRLRAGGTAREIFIGPVTAPWRNAGSAQRLATVAGFAGLAAAMAALFYPYLHASALYGFQRPWWMVYRMLPRPWSYLLSMNSRLWSHNLAIFNGMKFKDEHAMFTGAAVWVLFAVSVAGMMRGRAREWSRPLLLPLLLAMFFLVALTLVVSHKTFYGLVYTLPGLGAIRAVTRIIVVLLFPVAVVCAFGVEMLMERAREAKGSAAAAIRAAVAVAIAGLALEAVFIRHLTTSKNVCQSRLAGMQAAITAMHLPPGSEPVIFVPPRPGELFEFTELDGMLLAQQNGFATLNGYSGNQPPGVDLDPNADAIGNRIFSYLNFFGIADESRARALADRVLVWNGTGFERAQLPAGETSK